MTQFELLFCRYWATGRTVEAKQPFLEFMLYIDYEMIDILM